MKDVALNQGPCQTQELNLTLVFNFIWGSTCTRKEVPKKESLNNLKYISANEWKCGYRSKT